MRCVFSRHESDPAARSLSRNVTIGTHVTAWGGAVPGLPMGASVRGAPRCAVAGLLLQGLQAACGVHPARNSFSRLCVRQTSSHSLRALSAPRNEKRRKPRVSLICPNTGSTTVLRRA